MEGEDDIAPDSGGGAADSTPDTSAADSTPEVSPDTFGWDGWDGKEDKLPEQIRPWATKLGGYYGKQSELARQEADRVKQIYESLSSGMEDPRLAELQAKYDGETKTRSELAEQHRQVQQQLQEAQSHFQRYVDQQAESKAQAFQQANAWIFESPELQTVGAALLDEQFSADDLPVLLRMPEPLLEATRKVHKELISTGAKNAGAHAIRIARSEFKVPAPSPAAQKTAGANGPVPATSIPTAPSENMSLADRKNLAIERAMRLVK